MAKMDKLGQLAQERAALEAELKEVKGQLSDANMRRQRLECEGVMAFENAMDVLKALSDDKEFYDDGYLIIDRRYHAMEIKLSKSKQYVLRVKSASETDDAFRIVMYRGGHWTDYLEMISLPAKIKLAKQSLEQTQECLNLNFTQIDDAYHFNS